MTRASTAGFKFSVVALRLAAAILALGLAPASRGQHYHLRHYTIDDGLPSSQIRDISQDDLGRVWFATRAGIANYDGRDWTTYNLAHGLSWADQFALRRDREGGLWSVSLQAPFRIFRFEPGSGDDSSAAPEQGPVLEGGFWRQLPGPGKMSPECRITSFEVVTTQRVGGTGVRLAIGTARDGLMVLDAGGLPEAGADAWPESTGWRRVTRADGLPGDRVTALAVREGRLVIATAAGLVELREDGVPVPFETAGEMPPGAVAGLAVDVPAAAALETPSWRLWVIGDDWIGLHAGGRFALLAERLAIAPVPARRWIAQPDGQGGLFFADATAVYYFHPTLGFEAIGRRNGLLAEGASALLLDREENLWVGSQRGVTKIISRRFARYTRQQGLLDDEVTAALERRTGDVVLGHRGGISMLAGGAVRTLELHGSSSGRAQPEPVRDLAEDGAGNLWIAAETLGLARLAPAGDLTWLGAGDGLEGSVTTVLVDSAGGLWAATDQGLFSYRAGRFESPFAGAPKVRVRRLFEGPAGELLLATSSGLHRFHQTPAAGSGPDGGAGWHAWTCSKEAACDSVFAVLPRPDGAHWAGTSAGLYRAGEVALTRESTPAIDRPIFFMVEDGLRRVWFGTDNGVLRWDGRRLEHFTVRDGLVGRETNRAAGLIDSHGHVWIGTERGATVYNERLPGPRRAPPLVELSQVEAAGKTFSLEAPIELAYDENDLTFKFRVVSLIDEDRIQIQRRLDGLEEAWLPIQGALDREIRYTNLSPGSYRFHLRAANVEDQWSDVVTSAAITVARPYWQQPWFFALLTALLAGAVFFVQGQLAQRRYSRRLETEVADRVAELHASEERYRHIFERSQAVKLLLDAETLEILDANRAACRFYGYRPEELKRLTLEDLLVTDDPAAPDVRSTESATHLLAERHRLASGEIRDVENYSSASEMSGRPILYVIVHDVTKRRQAEETMSTERARLAATLRHIDDGVITTDAGGEILLLNRKAEEITGFPSFEAVGRPLEEILDLYEEGADGGLGDPLPMSGGASAGSRQTGSRQTGSPPSRAGDVLEPVEAAVLVARSGAHKLVELSGSPIRQSGGRLAGMVLAFRDITEKRKIESELAKAQKLEALGLLAGGIAHDFNNLLTVLLGNLSLLGRIPGLDGGRLKNLEDAETAVMRARDLTQQLLTFSRGGTPVREAASISEVLSESASFVLSGSKVRCEIDLPEDLWVVEIDAGQISQVVNNLLINAMQAMPEGGTVRISGQNLDQAPGSLVPGRYVAIHVADRGVGIPQEYLSRIFDPYFSTKDKGRGLGLASAYSIVKQHDGLLTVSSRSGRGTTFSIFLPASEVEQIDSASAPGGQLAGSGRILIMDDDPEVRSVTGSMAEQLGYEVEHAAEGAEAVEAYRRAMDSERPFDAVIMDLTIPGAMGGQTAIRHVLELDPKVRAIVVSGYSNDPVLANYIDYGFKGRISKPFTTDDLGRTLSRVLAEDRVSAPAGE